MLLFYLLFYFIIILEIYIFTIYNFYILYFLRDTFLNKIFYATWRHFFIYRESNFVISFQML